MELYCSEHSVMLLVQNRIHIQGRMRHVVHKLIGDSGKSSFVYLDDGVVFYEISEQKWTASSIQDLVARIV